jgi:TonB family protein
VNRGPRPQADADPLARAVRLPLTGDLHPLTREFKRWLFYGNGAALFLGLLAFGIWYALSKTGSDEPRTRTVKIVRYSDLSVPPSIAQPKVPQISISQAVAPPSIGIPEPVPDELAETPTIATVSEMSEALAPITLEDLGVGSGEGFVVDLDLEGTPSPDDFVAVEEEPIRISIDPPVYPEMAQSAQVEGTVLVRALVGKDGRVKDWIVVEGHPLLREAAIASARTAVFRPALLQHRPVEVWVMMPITFKLD